MELVLVSLCVSHIQTAGTDIGWGWMEWGGSSTHWGSLSPAHARRPRQWAFSQIRK